MKRAVLVIAVALGSGVVGEVHSSSNQYSPLIPVLSMIGASSAGDSLAPPSGDEGSTRTRVGEEDRA